MTTLPDSLVYPSTIQSKIAFQGFSGAFSDLACRTVFPEMQTYPCLSFEDTFEAVHHHQASLAMIPIENSVIGRIADSHFLLPTSGLHIIGEHYQPIHHKLLGVSGTNLSCIRRVRSHIHALEQCRRTLLRLGLQGIPHADTAGAAAEISRLGDPSEAAIASELAGELYNLDVLLDDLEDYHHNTTRFLIMGTEPKRPSLDSGLVMTSFLFQVRSVPAALFKALGGFATNGVNLTKIESYLIDGHFTAARFYVDVEGHIDDPHVRLAFEELAFFARDVQILGVYPAHPFRHHPPM